MSAPQKDERVRMCIDLEDLYKASLRDDFPLPHMDILVDNITSHTFVSFMDGYAGHNQVQMAEEDMEKTKFIT